MGLVYFDKRAFAYHINPVAPRQTTQFITPAPDSVHAWLSFLESNANMYFSLFLQDLVYDCVRAARAERGPRGSSANLEHGA